MSTEKETEIKSGLTLKAFIIATILEVIVLFGGETHGYLVGWTNYTLNVIDPYLAMTGSMIDSWGIGGPLNCLGIVVLLALVVGAINHFTKRSVLSRQEMAVIVAAMFIAMFPWDLYTNPWMNTVTLEGAVYGQPAELLGELQRTIPDVFKPGLTEDFWRRFLLTPYLAPDRITTVPWGAVLPMTLWVATNVMWWCFVFLFSVFLVRYIWFTVEYLESPPSEIIAFLVDSSQPAVEHTSSERVSVPFFKNKYFLVPLILVGIWAFACFGMHSWEALIVYLTTGNGDVANALRSSLSGGIQIGTTKIRLWPAFDLTPLAILPWVSFFVILAPQYIAWGLLLPVRILVNVIVASLALWWIYPIIMTSAGIWEAMPSGASGNSAYWNRIMGLHPTHDSMYALMWGCYAGLALVPVILHWRRFAPIFKSLYQKEPEGFDPEKPYSYRIIWIGLIVSAVAWLAMTSMLGVPLHTLILYLIMMTLITVGAARMVVEVGGFIAGWAFHRLGHDLQMFAGSWVSRWSGLTPQPGVPSKGAVAGAYLMYTGAHGSLTALGIGNTPQQAINIQASTKLRTRLSSVLHIQLWSTILAFFVGGIMFWWYVASRSDPAFPERDMSGWWSAVSGSIWRWTYEGAQSGTHPWVISDVVTNDPGPSMALALGGFVFIIIVPLLARAIPILSAISVAAVTFSVSMGDHMIIPFIVALIIKYVAIRVGGYALYSEKIRPVALGMFCGVALASIIGGIGQYWASWYLGR